MKKGFTLVELITSIVIITIISITAFYSIMDRLLNSRDSERMIDIRAIDFALKNYYSENNSYPIPDKFLWLKMTTFGTGYIWYQWIIWDNSIRDLKLKWKFQDPLDRSSYVYTTNYDQDAYEILALMEWSKYYVIVSDLFNKVNADATTWLDYSTRYPYTQWNSLGILLTKDKKVPMNFLYSGDYDLSTSLINTIVYFASDQAISGSWSDLQSIYQYMNNWYQPPSACPTWFIPIPWNKDFKQSGFCVAKYEMKQYTGDAWSWNGTAWALLTWTANTPYCSVSTPCNATASRNFTGAIISKSDGYPIVYLNQYNAMKACESMWTWYHLITNNEWMTIARNIESNNQNWWTGKYMSMSGSSADYWGINQWESRQTLYDGGIGALSGSSEYGYNAWVLSSSFENKRTHKLTNGEIIWDFAGNVREHVNWWNTINSSNYLITWNICGSAGYFSFYKDTADAFTLCAFTNNYTYVNIWPLKSNLNRTNWIWWIYSSATNNNIFLRGGSWINSWIYAINAVNISTYTSADVWFRCVY